MTETQSNTHQAIRSDHAGPTEQHRAHTTVDHILERLSPLELPAKEAFERYLSGSAGTVSGLPGEPGVFPGDCIAENNRPGLSSTGGTRRTSNHRSGSLPPPKAKKWPPTLHTARSHGTYKMVMELLAACGALLKARSWPFGLSLLYLLKIN